MADTIRSKAGESRPTHHIKFSDGITSIGVTLCNPQGEPITWGQAWAIRKAGMPGTSLQIAQGDPNFSTYEMPHTPVTQKDWSGGRGSSDLNKDATRFYDSSRIDTTGGDIICGPLETVASKIYSARVEKISDNAVVTETLTSPGTGKLVYFGSKFAAPLSFTAHAIEVKVARTGEEQRVLSVGIYSDVSGAPGVLLGGQDSHYPVEVGYGRVDPIIELQIITPTALVSGTTYWVVVGGQMGEFNEVDFTVAVNNNDSANKVMKSTDGATWAEVLDGSNHQSIYFRALQLAKGKANFFSHRGAEYLITSMDDLSTPMLYQNGYRGNAKTNSADKTKLNTSLGIGEDLTGAIVQIIAGPGSTEFQPWRKITSNTQTGSSDVVTVSPAWNIAHTTSTEFVIVNNNRWLPLYPAGFTSVVSSPPTCILETDQIIYVCQGEDANIARGKLKTDGTWETWVADGTNRATFLIECPDATGGRHIWRALAEAATVAKSEAKAWGTNLSFGGAIACGSTSSRITNLLKYDTPTKPHVIKENELGSVWGTADAEQYSPKPQAALTNIKDYRNGMTAIAHDVYLFFQVLHGMLERYFNDQLSDVGPTREEGLPANRQGEISAMIPYAGKIYIAVDAGWSGYSSVMVSNTISGNWHEIYRAPFGKRIRSMHVQTIPGDLVDRLWFNQDEEICWLPICVNPRTQEDYPYFSGGYVISSWINGTYREVIKFWSAVQNYANALVGGKQYVLVQYQTDADNDSSTWKPTTPLGFSTSPMQKVEMNPAAAGVIDVTKDVVGKRWRYKLSLYTTESLKSPRQIALTVDATSRVKGKKSYQLTFLIDDAEVDMQGTSTSTSVADRMALLEGWADSETYAKRIVMSSLLGLFDNMTVFAEQPGFTPVEVTDDAGKVSSKHICNMTVYQS